MTPHVSVVVPVFDNAGSIEELNRRLTETMADIVPEFEIVYVNDGSRDNSLQRLHDLAANNRAILVVDLERNYGQSAAILAGFSVARGDALVTIDADLENHPEDIPALVRALNCGADLVCGMRMGRQAPMVVRRLPSWFANRLVGNALSVDILDWGCGLNAVTSTIADRIVSSRPMPRLPKVEAALLATRIDQVPVAFSERRHGPSSYTPARLAGFALTFLLGFSPRRAWRRMVRRAAGDNMSLFASMYAFGVSALCWIVLTLLAVVARPVAWLNPRLAAPERFKIRSVTGDHLPAGKDRAR